MKQIIVQLFGEDRNLDILQMSLRAVVVFIVTLVLIRIAGRRSFGLRMPLDNIIVILLGAILSRAVVGVSPFLPVISCSFVIVIMHRFFGWLILKSERFGKLVEGNKFLVFENGTFIKKNIKKALASKEDIMQGVRKSALTEDMNGIEKVYMERNGEISSVKK